MKYNYSTSLLASFKVMSRKWMPFHCLLTWRGLVKRDTNTNYCLIIITSKTILIERYVYSFKSFFRMTFFRPFVCLRETTRERMFIHFRWKHIMLFPGTEFIFVVRDEVLSSLTWRMKVWKKVMKKLFLFITFFLAWNPLHNFLQPVLSGIIYMTLFLVLSPFFLFHEQGVEYKHKE